MPSTADKTKVCPITRIEFVDVDETARFIANSPYTWGQDYIDDDYNVLWTKDYDALPVSSTSVSDQPCMNPTETHYPSNYTPFSVEIKPKQCTQSDTN